METKVYTTIETITPQMAQVYLTHNTDNRNVRSYTVDFYARQMKQGDWQLNGDSIRFAKNGRLIDGQHRLKACIEAGVPFTTLVVRGLDGESQITMDKPVVRTSADTFKFSEIPNAAALSSIIKGFFALKVRRNTLDSKSGISLGSYKVSDTELLREYYKSPDLYQDISKESARCYDSCRAFPCTMIGAFIAYLVKENKQDKDYVYDFFEQLCDVRHTEYQVLRTCRRIFVNDKISNVHMIGSVKQSLIIKAWNYYVRKKDVKMFGYVNSTDKDIWFL